MQAIRRFNVGQQLSMIANPPPAPAPAPARTDNRRPINRVEALSLPSLDRRLYYDPPSPKSSSSSTASSPRAGHAVVTNAGNKLDPSARFVRKGKMHAWAPAYGEVHNDHRVRRRLKTCLEEFFPDASADADRPIPANIIAAEKKRANKKRKREEEKEWTLPHLASPSPPYSTVKLAPSLAMPHTYVDIMISPSMRHSLGDDSMETGLQRTAGELLDGEKGLMQALGRLREVLRVRERDVIAKEGAIEEAKKVNGNGHYPASNGTYDPKLPNHPIEEPLIPPLPHISDTDNLWRVTQELLQAQPQPTIAFTVTPNGAAAPTTVLPAATTTPTHRLFTCPTGITVNAIPPPHHPGYAFAKGHPNYPTTQKYNLDLANQRRAVDDALERISELLADCNEYKERLEEARDRVADVARARKKVWGVVKQRAGLEMDREEGRL